VHDLRHADRERSGEHALGPVHVRLVHVDAPRRADADLVDGTRVHDGIAAVAAALQRVGIGEIADDHVTTGLLQQVGLGRIAHELHDGVATRAQPLRDDAPEEAGRTGGEDPHARG